MHTLRKCVGVCTRINSVQLLLLTQQMGVLVRVIGQPYGFADGVSLRRYKPGQTYEMDPVLAEYMVLQGLGLFDLRRSLRSTRLRPNERRKNR